MKRILSIWIFALLATVALAQSGGIGIQPVVRGGTGSSTAAGARENLGVELGVDVETPAGADAKVLVETNRALAEEALKLSITDIPTSPEVASRAGDFYGPPSAFLRMARDAFEIRTATSATRKFSVLHLGDSLGTRCAGFLSYAWYRDFINSSASVALENAGELWASSGVFPPTGISLSVTAPAVKRSIAGENPDYTAWPTGTVYEVAASGIVKRVGGNTYTTAERIKVYYIQEPGAGTLDVQTSTNDADWTTIATIDADGALAGAVSSTSIARARVYIRVLGATGTVRVIGLRIDAGTGAGWLGSNMAVASLSLSDAVTTPAAIVQPIIADLDPSVITVHFDDTAAIFDSHFAAFKSLIGAPTATWIVIGNGPKSPDAVGQPGVVGAGDAVSQAQCDWLRANADALGFAFFDGMKASGSWAKIDALVLGGDGTHLGAALYQGWASRIIESVEVLTAPFALRNKGVSPRQTTLSKLEINGNEEGIDPASQATLAGDIIPAGANFHVAYRAARAHLFTSLTDAIIGRLVSFEGNSYNLLPGRIYYPNMSGAMPSTYTVNTTGGILYVESNEVKWRNGATGTITTLTAPPATQVVNTPAGNVAATTVQAAIDELDSEKLSTTGTAALATALATAQAINGVDFNGSVPITIPSKTPPVTVATLPVSPAAGDWSAVSDADSPTYGATVTGGGAVVTPVFFDGANWTCR